MGDLENCFGLPKLVQHFTAGNLTYFRVALTQLRMSLRLNYSNINFPSPRVKGVNDLLGKFKACAVRRNK